MNKRRFHRRNLAGVDGFDIWKSAMTSGLLEKAATGIGIWVMLADDLVATAGFVGLMVD